MSKKLTTKQVLGQAYNRKNYLDFLDGKFNFSKFTQAVPISDKDVKSFEQLGFITTADDKELPIFEIHIKPKTKLERNRVQLRNLVAEKILTEYGALAVFVDKTNKLWRFSFIAIEPILAEDGVKTEETSSKRFTYLFGEGEGEKIRTAKDQFEKLNKASTLADLKTAFAVGELNKEFYRELYKWYSSAQKQVFFPNDEKDENHIQTNLIRFLTRILFVWFLKEKKLINQDLFDLEKLKNLIDYEKDSSFYKAILQNLFFATLNRPIKDRDFRRTTDGQANQTNYLATNIYRYQNHFKNNNEKNIMALFKQTPFLNGGLFECLDREATDKEKQQYQQDKNSRKVGSAIRIDGFSDRTDNELQFNNQLLFNNNDQDLGLIDLFNQYQFTAEESTPTDIEVALDPELLGKIFENLLATYNPETGEQARKATGSFYTPRDIVSYMVDESLKQHFKTQTDLDEAKINTLFIEGKNTFNEQQIKSVINAIDTLKILDPAVGSGAYPMGVLQRLVLILDKIDPENKVFKQQQLDKTETMEEASKKASVEAIEQIFSTENQHNAYGKKLMLIENCMYGVDIQPIAIQICKLRFFISLTIEQKPNINRDNYGIKALPNLETKFIVANTLLSLGEKPQQGETIGMFDGNITKLQQDLAKVRHQYFTAKTLKTKRKYKEQDEQLRQQMLETLQQSGITPKVEASMKKVVKWDLYNQNSQSDWFDPEWMFGIKEGFDIVIGNPPYATYRLDKRYRKASQAIKHRFDGTQKNSANLFAYFIEKGISLLGNKGTLTFIIPHSISRVDGYKYIRQHINDNSTLWQIVDEYNQFDNVTLEMVTLFCSRNMRKPKYIKSLSNRENKTYQMPNNVYELSGYYPIYYDDIYKKISQNTAGKIGGFRGFDGLISNKAGSLLYIGGKNVKSYNIETGHKEYFVSMQSINLKKEEIVITQFGASPRGTIIETDKIIPSSGCVIIKHASELLPKFVLALINSSTIKYFFDRYIVNNAGLTVHLDGHYLKKIPIPKISKTEQQPFVKFADKILQAKQDDKDTTTLENQIDNKVYQLYDLTADEIKIIENTKIK